MLTDANNLAVLGVHCRQLSSEIATGVFIEFYPWGNKNRLVREVLTLRSCSTATTSSCVPEVALGCDAVDVRTTGGGSARC